jgi:hypothetical protein
MAAWVVIVTAVAVAMGTGPFPTLAAAQLDSRRRVVFGGDGAVPRQAASPRQQARDALPAGQLPAVVQVEGGEGEQQRAEGQGDHEEDDVPLAVAAVREHLRHGAAFRLAVGIAVAAQRHVVEGVAVAHGPVAQRDGEHADHGARHEQHAAQDAEVLVAAHVRDVGEHEGVQEGAEQRVRQEGPQHEAVGQPVVAVVVVDHRVGAIIGRVPGCGLHVAGRQVVVDVNGGDVHYGPQDPEYQKDDGGDRESAPVHAQPYNRNRQHTARQRRRKLRQIPTQLSITVIIRISIEYSLYGHTIAGLAMTEAACRLTHYPERLH